LTNTHTWSFHKRKKGVRKDIIGGEETIRVVQGRLWPEAWIVVRALDVDHNGSTLEVWKKVEGRKKVDEGLKECVESVLRGCVTTFDVLW